MKDKKNGIGTTSPVVETKDYWTNTYINVDGEMYEITSGDNLFTKIHITKTVLISNMDLLYDCILIHVYFNQEAMEFVKSKCLKAVFITKTIADKISPIAKRIYKYKTIKEKSSDKTGVVGKRKE